MPIASHVIVMGIDGLRPDMVNPKTMPALAELFERGARSLEHRTVYPSETRGALTSLVTGARPETTGVLGNEFYARGHMPGITRTQTIHDWHAAEERLTGGLVTATGLAETLAKAGRRLAVVTSSGQGSMTALSWHGRALGQIAFNILHPHIAHPHTLAADIEAAHHVPASGFAKGAVDAAIDIFTRSIWPAAYPAASIIWLTEVDSASHRHGLGHETMLETMAACDRAIARLLEWRLAQPERDEIAIFITSDHGHSTIGEFVSTTEALRQQGFSMDGVVHRRGRAPSFWFKQPDAGRLAEMAAILAEQPWAGTLLTSAIEPGGHEGRVPGTLATGLTGAGHARSADLILHLAGNDDENAHGHAGVTFFDGDGYGTPLAGGSHGGMHPAELNAVLVGEGAGLKATQAASRTGIQDIAPTLLHLLDVPFPFSMTGRVLHELLDQGEAVQAPQTTTLTASARGRESNLSLTTVNGQPYVDEASHRLAGAEALPARRRDDLQVVLDAAE